MTSETGKIFENNPATLKFDVYDDDGVTFLDIATATGITVEYQKPDGTQGVWTDGVGGVTISITGTYNVDQKLECDLPADVLTPGGNWIAQPDLTLSGWTGLLGHDTFFVHEKFG